MTLLSFSIVNSTIDLNQDILYVFSTLQFLIAKIKEDFPIPLAPQSKALLKDLFFIDLCHICPHFKLHI